MILTLTVESVSRLLTSRFNDFKTTGSIKRLVDSRELERVASDPQDPRYSVVNYRISIDSVISYLEGKGYPKDEIEKVFSLI